MPGPSAQLIALYEQTQYRVRLPHGGHAVIRVHAPLPPDLLPLLPSPQAPWAFLTACNPYSQPLSATDNRMRQRRLLQTLRDLPGHLGIHPGIGVGPADAQAPRWREPSLFVTGITLDQTGRLMHQFEQNAAVCGSGSAPCQLQLHMP